MAKLDYKRLRSRMVDEQLIPRGIHDKAVISAFRKVSRHEFVSESEIDNAYSDFPLPIGDGQTISQPYIVALMTELLSLKKTEKILEIGTGSGYQTAILAELGSKVYSVERYKSLADKAAQTLSMLGYNNIRIKVCDGTLGWKEQAPYDAIIVTAGAPRIPVSLTDQLNESGRLVIPVGEYYGQNLVIATKRKGKIESRVACGCVFVPLVGADGWEG